ncbi:unnamed protein product [Mytilus edulis]|uniref:Uncharacterized protein n=1 Tax=Mytilus edulis TaxID=6550 RepID=A0A8S3PNE0_MYTED|nr:unnamed protein product [Mytilus edulis]
MQRIVQLELKKYQTIVRITTNCFHLELKLVIRGKTISYSSFKKKQRSREEAELESQLNNLNNNENINDKREEITRIELQLRSLRESRIKGAIMRAKAKWQIEGERSTKYFCNLEKRNYIEKVIQKLTLDNGETITDQAKIRAEQKLYYENLYSSKKTLINNTHRANFFSLENPFIKILSDEQNINLEGELKKFGIKNKTN